MLAALLLGGYWGGLAGAVGMTIGDLTTSYVTSAPKTFLLKLFIGLIVGFVAHKLFKLDRDHDAAYVTRVTILASACGMISILSRTLLWDIFTRPICWASPRIWRLFCKISLGTTTVNAVLAVILASVFYLALRPALKKSGLFVRVTPDGEETKE